MAAVIWRVTIFKATNAGLVIILYIVTGLSLASWTHLVAVPFSASPTLAAITCESGLFWKDGADTDSQRHSSPSFWLS
jgi:hypothetical protein